MPDFYRIEFDEDSPVYWARELASLEAAKFVIEQPQGGTDFRSDWYWIRLPNGDLVLATYPQGDTYETTEQWRTI